MRQRCHPQKTARGSSIPNRILRTFHALALPATENSERVVDSKQKSQDAPRTSDATRQKQREGCRSQAAFAGRSTRQRCHPPKTARGSSILNRISRTLHAPRCRPQRAARRSSIPSRISRTLHAPTLPPTENSGMVEDTVTRPPHNP